MSLKRCIIEVEKAIGRKLDDKEFKDLERSVEGIVEKFGKETHAEELSVKVMDAIEELAQDVTAAAIIEKRNAVLNAKSKIMNQEYLTNVWGDDPAEGIKAMLGSSLVDRQGSKNGAAVNIDSLAHSYVSGMTSKLVEKDLLKVATSGKFDDQIWKAMSELSNAEPDLQALKKLTSEAVDIAKIFNEYNELARINANKAGSWIKKLPGYVLKRTHDPHKIAKAGGSRPVNDLIHAKAWKEFISERLDWDKTMPDISIERRDAVLSDMFQDLANGLHVKASDNPVSGLKGIANIGKRLSHERVLHFKTPEVEFEYFKTYSQGGTIAESMLYGLRSMARDTGLMRKFGPNAKANLEEVVKSTMLNYKKQGRGDLAAKLQDGYNHQMERLWPVISGEINIPGNKTFASWSQTIRFLSQMADLGSAALSSVSDIGFYGATMRYTGTRNAQSFFEGMGEAIGGLLEGVSSSKVEKAKLASEFSIMIDGLMTPVSKFSADVATPGRISSWTQTFFKYNGLSFVQDSLRLRAAVATGHRHFQHAGLKFKELPEGVQAIFRQFDITDADWNVIRKTKASSDTRGRSFFTPETIEAVGDEALAEALSLKTSGKISKPKITKYRQELASKYRSLFTEISTTATSEPGMVERAIMLNGSRPGTLTGELYRHFWMYKSFTVSVMRKHMGRELFGYGQNRTSVATALFNMMKDPGGSGFGGMANLVVWGTMLGYVSMSLKDISKGKTPRVPKDTEGFLKIFAAAAAQSGSMGIYGDFLFGEMKSRFGHGPLETFLGPTWKRVSDVTDLFGRFKAGDDFAARGANLILNNTPGLSAGYGLFYTRWALDYLIVYRMQEMMNPGYLRRMEKRLKKQKLQEFIYPPSKAVR